MNMTNLRVSGYDLRIGYDDISVCYNDLGDSDIPIIFIHGFPFDKSMWDPQINLLKNSYRTIAYDIRGFGQTSSKNRKVSFRLFTEDLIGFMDALEIEKAIVCGLSMGGYIVLNAIHQHEDRFKALILCDTQCNADSETAKEIRFNSIRTIMGGGM